MQVQNLKTKPKGASTHTDDAQEIELRRILGRIRKNIATCGGDVTRGLIASKSDVITVLVEHKYTPTRMASRLGSNVGSTNEILCALSTTCLSFVIDYALKEQENVG